LSKVLNTREKRFKSRYVRSVQKRVTTLRAELGRDVSISEIKEALGRGFELTYKIRLFEGELTREEEELAGILYRKKYSKDEWNLHARNSTL
jgi:lipoate-protein ligase A